MRFDPAAEDDLFTMMDIATHAAADVPAIVERITPLLRPA